MDDTVQNYVTSHSVEEGYAGRIDVVTGPSGRNMVSGAPPPHLQPIA
jgi:hypothetical protein